MAGTSTYLSPFERVFDVVVVGCGYAGFAAAMAASGAGRSVLLVGTRGDLVWESGRGFCPDAGECDEPAWIGLVDAVAARGGVADGWMDGAIAEVAATDQLMSSDVRVLYYARPVAVQRAGNGGGAVVSLVVATKSGLRRVVGRQWVDATESGELARLVDPGLALRAPVRAFAHLMLQHADWSSVGGTDGLRSTAWPTERVFSVDVEPDDAAWRERVLTGLGELEELLGEQVANVSVSHLSIEPVAQYAAGEPTRSVAGNVACAVPGLASSSVVSLADRFALGVSAARELAGAGSVDVSSGVAAEVLARSLPRAEPVRTVSADVCVAGVGTGGAVAALASAQTGARVVCVEPSAFAGGIGTGGGIHGYWLGVPGGFQQEVDRRTRELMKRFRGGPLNDGPFNPWAKMIALEQMMREQGVDLRTNALLFDVEKSGERVVAALAATPDGVVRVEANGFVDGTGDGDLCALAGAEFTLGREHDGLSHAYTQSSGMLRDVRGRPRMGFVNFDAGFCDPTDPEDMTRARLVGIRQYLIDRYDNFTRPTYIAPALGLRQSRQVVTDYVLTLDDQIRRRRFSDPIGYTGSHVENHATDYEFESDEALFWVWANRQWTSPVACELSYRMLVPRGLSNVWIASRCAGISQDAHYSTRMQRDVQRLGEAAGFSAGEAVRRDETSHQLPYAELRKWLDQTGALDKEPRSFESDFGTRGGELLTDPVPFDESSYVGDALAALDRGEPGEAIWWLYRHEDLVRDAVLQRLTPTNGQKPMVSWLAAGVLAMWGELAAEPRLVEAIETCEYGFGEGYEWTASGPPFLPDNPEALEWKWVVPNWLCAVALLRRCGTEACLPAIERLLDRPVHGINTLTTVAITLQHLVQRGVLTGEAVQSRVEAILDRILNTGVVGTYDYSGRHVGWYSERAVRGEISVDDSSRPKAAVLVPTVQEQVSNTYEDKTWQLHLAVARARVALGLPVHDEAKPYTHDDRAFVRRAFTSV